MNIDTRTCQILCQLNFQDGNKTIFQNNEERKKKCQNHMTF
jgi:hypothetical protein